jgi:hypothetical protein
MMSLEAYCICRVALAEKMLRDPDPRLKAAFAELRAEMFKTDTERLIDASRVPSLLRAQI